MVTLSDLSFAIYDVSNGGIESVDPSEAREIPQGTIERGFAEKATELLYRHHFDLRVAKINERRKSQRLGYALGIDGGNRNQSRALPAGLADRVLELIRERTGAESDTEALRTVSIDGIPDFLVCKSGSPNEFRFVEAKREQELLQRTQVDWFDQFDFLPVRISYVFDRPADRNRFVERNSLERLLEGPDRQRKISQMGDREELPDDELARRISELQAGDRVVFNQRKIPMEVTGIGVKREVRGTVETGAEVINPKGKRYLLSDTGEFFVEQDNRRNLKWVQRVSDE